MYTDVGNIEEMNGTPCGSHLGSFSFSFMSTSAIDYLLISDARLFYGYIHFNRQTQQILLLDILGYFVDITVFWCSLILEFFISNDTEHDRRAGTGL